MISAEASPYGIVLTGPPDILTDGTAPTLEAAKAEFGASWKRWLDWAKLEEVAGLGQAGRGALISLG
jgi:hypothetical protein